VQWGDVASRCAARLTALSRFIVIPDPSLSLEMPTGVERFYQKFSRSGRQFFDLSKRKDLNAFDSP
jgi:hypothetical protein